jgi:glycosyltransferase involved in cell wall biosynthesis
MNLLILNRYGRSGASSRLRSLQFLPWLEKAGIHCTVHSFFDDELLAKKYVDGQYGFSKIINCYIDRVFALLNRKKFDFVWIEKEALPWFPTIIEHLFLRGTPYILDFDDAIFHQYDEHPNPFVRYFLGDRIDRLMSRAFMVVAGNNYLAQRARNAGCTRVEVVPTVIDLDRYAPKYYIEEENSICRIVWIGSPSTAKYLQMLMAPLIALRRTHTFKLRVIGVPGLVIPSVDVEAVEWTEASEVDALRVCDIGVMPLIDGSWERGKCGYKLIQYMACALPVVGSAVGVNSEIICHGVNGYLASANEDWVACLATLIDDAALRYRMGQNGREQVEDFYCVQQIGPKYIKIFH